MDSNQLLGPFRSSIVDGNEDEAMKLAGEALAQGMNPMVLIEEGITPALDEVGKSFDCGDAFLPQLIMSGDAAMAALKLIIPNLSAEDRTKAVKGKVVIGTIFGDAHDIGKNIVIGMLSARGMQVIDLGVNVPVKEYIDTAIKEKADIIAVSSLLTTSLPYHRQLISLLRDRGLRDQFYVIVGGGPVTPKWAREIGADGYGRDANDAAMLCQKLLECRQQGTAAPLAEPIVFGALQ